MKLYAPGQVFNPSRILVLIAIVKHPKGWRKKYEKTGSTGVQSPQWDEIVNGVSPHNGDVQVYP